MKLIFLIMLTFSVKLPASDLNLAPKSFISSEKKYVFMDMIKADYTIVYDVNTKLVKVKSVIDFKVQEEGRPLFDLKASNIKALVNNMSIDIVEVKLPENASSMLSLDMVFKPGNYQLSLEHVLTELVVFGSNNVKSAFWMSDLTDRAYLEKYLPTNLEFDHYQMNFDVEIIGTDRVHELMLNCEKKTSGLNSWTATCPDYYTASSLFFHIFDLDRFQIMTRSYKSANLTIIPITVYGTTSSINTYLNNAQKILSELERDYGAWPHKQLIIYAAGNGGMEYSGATMTSLQALGHEMHHSYFARGIIPANGNSGWLDEALARWRDNGYRSYYEWQLTKTDMGAHSIYRRSTDRLAYTAGEKFIGHLEKLTSEQGGMKAFLKDLRNDYLYKSMTTTIFKDRIKEYFKINADELFNTYIFYKNKDGSSSNRWKLESEVHNPYHPILSKEELINLL